MENMFLFSTDNAFFHSSHSSLRLPTDGTSRIICYIFFIPPYIKESFKPTSVSRVASVWDLWRTLYRLSYSSAATDNALILLENTLATFWLTCFWNSYVDHYGLGYGDMNDESSVRRDKNLVRSNLVRRIDLTWRRSRRSFRTGMFWRINRFFVRVLRLWWLRHLEAVVWAERMPTVFCNSLPASGWGGGGAWRITANSCPSDPRS